MVLVVASSSIDSGIGCWDLHTGAEQLRYKSCASPAHGLVCVGERFLACSQLRDPAATAGSVLYWSWCKPQVEVKSFPAEPIMALASNDEGTYIVGGGLSGDIYLWEVLSGRLLKKWHAHYRAVTCLVFSEDDSLLISGSEDGCIRVWALLTVFDDGWQREAKHLYEHSFTGHNLPVTDIVVGYGGSNAIIISSSVDRTCKVWSLSKGKLLRNIIFPSIIDVIALDPGEHVFYGGGRDGKIYTAALNAKCPSTGDYGLHILGSLSNQSKSVTALAYCSSGNLLISGSEDGAIRVWDTRTNNVIRVFRHSKGPVNNILLVRQQVLPKSQSTSQGFLRKHRSLLPPALAKFENSKDEDEDTGVIIGPTGLPKESMGFPALSSHVMDNQITELQQQGSAANGMELERLKYDCGKSMQMLQHWRKMYDNLHQFCVNELLDGDQTKNIQGNSA
ncbi:protein ROOT INITIATION DEFECTIVE 3 [Benincasa hispida]|uniref:protein ROOT INITIATION DEFECTIVE 3 n=1 Tax=Benincasa hispida TaxID=102211 RepID=UPI0018FF863C|nr:protein ROOT INITIATION DEFECTIVE 3 [Benincasa hispida]